MRAARMVGALGYGLESTRAAERVPQCLRHQPLPPPPLRASQVLSYGEMGAVTLPGARVLAADGWEGPAAEQGEGWVQQQQEQQQHSTPARGEQQQQQQQPCGVRLRAGDVVLRVGGVALPAGGNMVGNLVAVREEQRCMRLAATTVAVRLARMAMS